MNGAINVWDGTERAIKRIPRDSNTPAKRTPIFAQIQNPEYWPNIMDSVQREAQITLALADLANQEHPNFKGTTRAYKVNRTTLYR
jgi:hypothetical protein